jgi:hypothetical protein
MKDLQPQVSIPQNQQIEFAMTSSVNADIGDEETVELRPTSSALSAPLKGTAYPQNQEDPQHTGEELIYQRINHSVYATP